MNKIFAAIPPQRVKYLANSFSLNMVKPPCSVNIEPCDVKFGVSFETSIVGHDSTAEVFSALLGQPVPVNRAQVSLAEGDTVLVGQIPVRPPEGKVLSKAEVEALGVSWLLVTVYRPIGEFQRQLDECAEANAEMCSETTACSKCGKPINSYCQMIGTKSQDKSECQCSR